VRVLSNLRESLPSRQHPPLAEALVRLWAAAAIRAELVELCELLLERTDHLVVPPGLHGRTSRAEVFAAHCCAEAFGYGLLNNARPYPGREGVFFDEAT
jgi:hypothetical protein